MNARKSDGTCVLFPSSEIETPFIPNTYQIWCLCRRQTGHGNTPDQSKERIRRNDRPNGEQVQTTKAFADVVVVPV
jgi:hypothetical protein